MKKTIVSIVTLVAFSVSFSRANAETIPRCDLIENPSAMYACVEKYGKCNFPDLLNNADRADCHFEKQAMVKGLITHRKAELEKYLNKAQLTKLRKAERSFQAHLEAQCAFEASAYEGGTLASQVYASCAEIMTEEHANVLKNIKSNFAPH
jgi:uncharacterized protein YecT (DUF1311 family)